MKDYVSIDNMILPDLSKSFKINAIMAYIYDIPDSRYDIIFGRDVLEHMNVDVCYSTHTVTWLHHTIQMKNEDFFQSALNLYYTFNEDDILDQGDLFIHEILPSKYGKVEIDSVIQKQSHLNQQQKFELKQILEKVDKLFNGTLGCYPH